MNRYTVIIVGLILLILGRFAVFTGSHRDPARDSFQTSPVMVEGATSRTERFRKPSDRKTSDSEWYLDPERQKTDLEYAERVYRFLKKQESTLLLEMYGKQELRKELELILVLFREYLDEDQARGELRDTFEDLGRIEDLRKMQEDALKYRDERGQLYGKSDSNQLMYQLEMELNQSKIQKMSAALKTRLQIEYPQLDDTFFEKLFVLSAKSNIPDFQIQSGIQPGQPLFEKNGRWVLWDEE